MPRARSTVVDPFPVDPFALVNLFTLPYEQCLSHLVRGPQDQMRRQSAQPRTYPVAQNFDDPCMAQDSMIKFMDGETQSSDFV